MSRERRQSFRIDNPVVLLYKIVSEREIDRNAASVREGGFLPGGVSSTLFGMEAEFKGRVGRIKHKTPEVAHALELLNNKLNALINLMPMMQEQDENIFEQPMRKTNVSSTGIAFVNEEYLEPDTCLYMRLLLAPDYYYIAAYARVVRSEERSQPVDGFRYRVAVEFTLISDQHREMLVKYTMSRELAMLRARRMASDMDVEMEADAEDASA